MQRICAVSGASFTVSPADEEMLQKLSPQVAGHTFALPLPTLCPNERQRRRLSWRNERNLYRRPCDKTGQDTVSIYDAKAPFPVYAPDVWNSDNWDPLEYGQEFDFNRPFFEQYLELRNKIPRLALHIVNNENCPYINLSSYNKNCHLLFAAEYNEDCLYGTEVIKCTGCSDTMNCFESQYCYECIDVDKCYQAFFAQNCSTCKSSAFLLNCRSCTECLLCCNLRNQQYCIWNKQLTQAEYEIEKEHIWQQIRKGKLEDILAEFDRFTVQHKRQATENLNCENATGDYLKNSKNVYKCYDVNYAEDCRYVTTGFQVKDLMDVCHTTEAERGYDSMSLGYGAYDCVCTHGSWTSRNTLYCDIVQSCNHAFGCVGLKHKQYCILNKQYTKEEYEQLVPQIIEHMQKTTYKSVILSSTKDDSMVRRAHHDIPEWGQFFPAHLSPFAYNESYAQEYFPLSQLEVQQRSLQWKTEEIDVPQVDKVIPADKLPSDINAIPDDVLNWAITCTQSKKPFRILKQELDFYRQFGLPLPHLHHDERFRKRFLKRNPRQLWNRQCSTCQKDVQSSYKPEQPEEIVCKECFRKEVY